VFYAGQYGFRNNHSTSLALMDLMEEITTSLDKKQTTVGVLIDLKKAFDTIDHGILIKKMYIYGVRGIALKWLESYLKDRLQYVMLNDTNSGLINMLCGVPQGSILGPTLFLLYINDMHNVSDILSFILFADDTNIFYTGNNVNDICSIMNRELKMLSIWFKVNKLSLNIAKTNFMVFTNKLNSADFNLHINNVVIERVFEAKFLGVIIDCKLNWSSHIKYIQSKIAKSLSIMYKVKYLLDSTSLFMLYSTLILPYLYYCCEVWANTYESRLKRLIVFQKRAIRIVERLSYRAHTNDIFVKLNTLKFCDIVKLKTALVVYKAKCMLLPNRLIDLFKINTNETRQKGLFKVVYRRTKTKSFSVSHIGVQIWNDLPDKVKASKSLSMFKCLYKKYLLNTYVS